MTAPFRPRFEAMVAALRAHPEIEVYEAFLGPRATHSALRDAEEAIGAPLPPALRAFYEAHDGAFLEWGLRERTYADRTDIFGYPDYGQPPGCINILPVAHAMSPAWEEDSHVNEIQPDHQALLFGAPLDPQPKVRAVCLDNFSKYNHGDLVLGPTPVMLVSTDHGADMEASDFCDVSTYLDMTLALYGLNRYYYGVGIGWTRAPQRLDAWTQAPTLDGLLARLRDDDRA